MPQLTSFLVCFIVAFWSHKIALSYFQCYFVAVLYLKFLSSYITPLSFCVTIPTFYIVGKAHEPGSNPKKWKTNFRCALNSLPDVAEVKQKESRKGDDAYRVYKFLEANQKHLKHSSKFGTFKIYNNVMLMQHLKQLLSFAV